MAVRLEWYNKRWSFEHDLLLEAEVLLVKHSPYTKRLEESIRMLSKIERRNMRFSCYDQQEPTIWLEKVCWAILSKAFRFRKSMQTPTCQALVTHDGPFCPLPEIEEMPAYRSEYSDIAEFQCNLDTGRFPAVGKNAILCSRKQLA